MNSVIYIDERLVQKVVEFEEFNSSLEGFLEEINNFDKKKFSEIISKKKKFLGIIKKMKQKIEDNKKKKYLFVDKDTENYLHFEKRNAIEIGNELKRLAYDETENIRN